MTQLPPVILKFSVKIEAQSIGKWYLLNLTDG